MRGSPANERAITGIKAKLINRIRTLDPNLANELSAIKLDWFKVVNADGTSEDDGPKGVSSADAEIFIYDEIGGSFGVDATELVMAINEISADNINVRINSPGGSVFDAIAIYNALIKNPANVTTYVDALAASAASIIAMAGDEVVMMPGSQMMIHDALGMEFGNENDMRAMADFLGKQSDNIASIYQARVGGDSSVGDWRNLMLAETWMFAGEAVEAGLADRVFTPPTRQEVDPNVDPQGAPPDQMPPEQEPEKPGETEPEKPGETEPENELDDAYAKLNRRHTLTNRGFKHAGRKRAPEPPLNTNGFAALYGTKG